MNWINNVVRPKIRGIWRKRDVPDNLWIKCPETGQMIYHKDLEANLFVVPGSNYHMRMSAKARLENLFNGGEYETIPVPEVPHDPLKFRDERKYSERLKTARENTELKDAIFVGEGTLDGLPVVAAVQDFKFMGGSVGMAAGEAVVTGMLRAVELEAPFIIFAASGGARMQEGILSLMQMPRTTIAVQKLREAGLPYIVVLTHPTTGGVTASYAMLGDIHIAEPRALIGFAGPRVIEQTIREQLPPGFQRAEYLLEHGMVDMVVHRHELRATLGRICRMLMRAPALEITAGEEERATLDVLDEADDDETERVNGTKVGAEVIEAAEPSGEGEPITPGPGGDESRNADIAAADTTSDGDGEAGEVGEAGDEQPVPHSKRSRRGKGRKANGAKGSARR